MLKTAKMFKTFSVSMNGRENSATTFTMNDAIDVEVKNDNFATQIQVYDKNNTIDFFDYKYITFDEHAFFEIVDCIKNGNYATLFIQYVSDITFNTPDGNFRVKAQTIKTLQRLGLNFSELMQILGDTTIQTRYPLRGNNLIAPFIYAIKIRFSEIPQNLKYAANGNTSYYQSKPYDNSRGMGGNAIYNPSAFGGYNDFPTRIENFRTFDNAVTAYVFLPNQKKLRFTFGAEHEDGSQNVTWALDFSIQNVMNALDALITDLTLSVEITVVDSNSLCMIDYGDGQYNRVKHIPITQSNDRTEIRIVTSATAQRGVGNTNTVLKWFRFIGTNTPDKDSVPVLLMQCDTTSTQQAFWGFWENLNLIQLDLRVLFGFEPRTNARRVIVGMKMLNNVIDLSGFTVLADYPYLYIKREIGYLRVYGDIRRNMYADIQTTFEFAQNAYSNYEAYRAANIELTNRQNFDALKLQQKQQRELQNIDTAKNVVGTISNTVKGGLGGFLSGGPIGAIAGAASNLFSGLANIGFDEAKFNIQQQNEIANAKLSAQQAHERAAKTIVPSSEITGKVSPQTYLMGNTQSVVGILFEIYTVEITTAHQLVKIQDFVFENAETEGILWGVSSTPSLTPPPWKFSPVYQVKIENRSPVNTRKDFTIWVKG